MKRRIVAPLAVVAAVAAGGAAGALIGVPGISGAQETQQDAPSPDSQAQPDHKGPGPLVAAAEALGMDIDDLRSEVRDGKTIAEIAQEKGVDVNTVIDAMVADALDKIDRSEDEIRDHITTLVNEGLPEGPGRGGPGSGGPGGRMIRGGGAQLDAAAEALGMSTDDLADALHDGQTIADIAQDKGVDVQTVIDAMVAQAREHIEDFVNNGLPKPPAPPEDAPAPPEAEQSGTAS